MGMATKIKILLWERHITVKELASRLETSGSNLCNKLARDNFSEKELLQIAEALDCDYNATFTLRDSGKII